MSLRAWIIAVFVCALMAARAVGQTAAPSAPTTEPAMDAANWEEAVGSLVKVLTDDTEDAATLSALLPDSAVIQRFGANEADSRYKLHQKTAGLTTVSAHAYGWPADKIAEDLASSVKAFANMPDELRRQFVPRDDAETKKFNAVAHQWVAGSLRPVPGQLVAVILLWEPPPSIMTNLLMNSAATPSDLKQPLFVLVKGQKSDDGQFQVTQVCYGDSRQALN
jgi:hypothetical protein